MGEILYAVGIVGFIALMGKWLCRVGSHIRAKSEADAALAKQESDDLYEYITSEPPNPGIREWYADIEQPRDNRGDAQPLTIEFGERKQHLGFANYFDSYPATESVREVNTEASTPNTMRYLARAVQLYAKREALVEPAISELDSQWNTYIKDDSAEAQSRLVMHVARFLDTVVPDPDKIEPTSTLQ